MRSSGYESVSKSDETPGNADSGTEVFAYVVSVLGCLVSLAAIGFVVHSLG